VPTSIDGVYRIEREIIHDTRGFFSRLYCSEELKKINFNSNISQVNYSFSKLKGTVRGMHFQINPHAETKIVTCLNGSVFDVAVDLRYGATTFLKWHAEVLSSENKNSLFIPEGFAHGFQTLSDDCQLLYLHSELYTPSSERSLNAMDPKIGINWPIQVSEISEKDINQPFINSSYIGISTNEM